MVYVVQEFVAGKWLSVRSFTTLEAATQFGSRLGKWRLRQNGKTIGALVRRG